MELRHVRYFLAVVDAGSVTAASHLVHVTQPSLSRQLRLFERDLGITLFSRSGGRLVLSAAGRQFVPVARDLARRAEAAAEAAATLAAGRLQHIRIAAPGTTFTDVLAPFLATLNQDDPLPAVWEERPQRIYAALSSGADLAIATERPPAGLAFQPLAVLPIWAYVPAGHDWATRGSVTVAELVLETLLLLTPDYSPRRVLDHSVEQSRLTYSSMLEFGTPQVAQAVAAAGRGIAVVSDDPRFGLQPLDIIGRRGALSIRLYAAWGREHHAATALAALARRLSDYCVARYGPQVAPRRPTTPRTKAPSTGVVRTPPRNSTPVF
ncbi:MAG: LysR family transcriptional regulator [Dermatophilaceae bacterium]